MDVGIKNDKDDNECPEMFRSSLNEGNKIVIWISTKSIYMNRAR